MSDAPPYLTGVTDQFAAAVDRGDVEAVCQIIDGVDVDGYPAVADALEASLAGTSLGDQIAE